MKFDDISAVWIQFTNVTDGQTPSGSKDRAYSASRGKNTASRSVLGGWVWLTSVTPAVIGRPSKNVGLQFGKMSTTNGDDVFGVGDNLSATLSAKS